MAFSEEIFWAGITSVPRASGRPRARPACRFGQTLMNVVLPQALRLTIPPLTNRTIAITKGTALGTVVAVTEILGQASSAMSNSYNPSPLMMGAAAYLVLFLPGRRGGALDRDQVRVEAMIQTFFNPEIIAAAWPIVLAGLLNTILLSLIVVPLGLLGGLILALLAQRAVIRWCAGR